MWTRRRFSRLLPALALCRAGRAATDDDGFRFAEPHMGCLWSLVLHTDSKPAAAEAARVVFARIAALDACLSDYQPQSELNRLSATAGTGRPTAVSDDLFRLLVLSRTASAESTGRFDLTLGPLTALWRRSRRQGVLPGADALALARAATGWQSVVLDPAARTATLTKPGMKLDAGGIAKGYAMDAAFQLLRECGISSALLDAAGEVGVSAPPPGRDAWTVSIQSPAPHGEPPAAEESVAIRNSFVATSGDFYQFVEIDGQRYSHIIDPSTGLGQTTQVQASVIAGSGALADRLATTLCLMPADAALPWLEKHHSAVSAEIHRPGPDGHPLRTRTRTWPA